jgi:glycosyltransferase involved in cell wall biosynthesis
MAEQLVSVVLCSHNGADTLPRVLEALKLLETGETTIEFVLVDNASKDETAALMEAWKASFPKLVLREPRKGKSFALNRALAAASGQYVAFIDDDIVVSPGWLEAYRSASTLHPSVGVFTGQIRLEWDATPPGWLARLEQEGRVLGATDARENAAIHPVRFTAVKGGNVYLVRRNTLDARFDEGELNYGSGPAGGEDTHFARSAAGPDGVILFVPEALVHHIVRPEQIGLKPYVRRQYRIALGQLRRDGLDAASLGPVVLGVPLGAARKALGLVLGLGLKLATLNTSKAVSKLNALIKLYASVEYLKTNNS